MKPGKRREPFASNALGLPTESTPDASPRTRLARRTLYAAGLILIIVSVVAVYITSMPERSESYEVLRRVGVVGPPKRFELINAPAGEFLDATQLEDRYGQMSEQDISAANKQLVRQYLLNYRKPHELIPYVVGRYKITRIRELSTNDVFETGVATSSAAVGNERVVLEHIFPAPATAVEEMEGVFYKGLELQLQRDLDRSVVIHVERSSNNRIVITAVPLLYGTYSVIRGEGTFNLEPPNKLNVRADWRLFTRDP